MKMLLAAGLGLLASQAWLVAADDSAFKDDKEKASYAAGMRFGDMIKSSSMDLDLDTVVSAMKDVLAGKEPRLTQQQSMEVIRSYQEESRKKVANKNKEEGQAFLEATKKKEGVKALSVKLNETNTVEMLYKVITEGTGAIPKSNDMVSVNYRGTLINGKEFDSSFKRGQPAKFAANRVIRGWTEALQLMKVGSKYELYIPATLAYGERGSPQGNIEPGATLIFEVELLGIEAPPPPPAAAAPSQPLTSDIIKVPSAEELKKGAKIEVIKPEDIPKHIEQEKKQQDSEKK
jgi:FKBP-type peptidyl-prolyl cis-trans isomerase